MDKKRLIVIASLLIVFLAVVIFAVSLLLQPELIGSSKYMLILVGLALAGAASFIANLKDGIELVQMLITGRSPREIELEEKIRELENRLPQLDLFFEENGNLTKHYVITVPRLPQEPDYDRLIQQESSKLREAAKSMKNNFDINPLSFADANISDFKPIETYQDECAIYLKKYRRYLGLKYERDLLLLRLRQVKMVLKNFGQAQAQDVRITVQFPKVFHIPNEGEDFAFVQLAKFQPDYPERPNVPQPISNIRESFEQFNFDRDRMLSQFPFDLQDIPTPPIESNVTCSWQNKEEGTRVTFDVKKLLHGFVEDDLDFGDLIIRQEAINESWELRYKIHAAELPNPISGSLLLEVKLSDK